MVRKSNKALGQKYFAVLCASVSSVLILASCGTRTYETVKFLISVKGTCGSEGFNDIGIGAELDISDSSGKIIGTSTLKHRSDLRDECDYYADDFQVPQTTDGLYRAHVGNIFRGTTTSTATGHNEVWFTPSLGFN